jgi:hypothetical protein
MTVEERMDRLERALGAHDELIRELRDGLIVNARLQADQERRQEAHAKWLEEHERAMKAFDERLDRMAAEQERTKAEHERTLRELAAERDRAKKELDERIANLVSAIGEFIRESRRK